MPSLSCRLALAGATLATTAVAHGLVPGFSTDGVYHQGWIMDYYYQKLNTGSYPSIAGWYEEATDNGYVASSAYSSPDIVCHKNAQNAQTSASVKAGGTVEFFWTTWPQTHIGDVLTYVAKCGDAPNACSSVDKTTLQWVKIDEAGINLQTQQWAAIDLMHNNNSWSVTVPPTLASGNYVFRHEIIALHGAGGEGGGQHYPFCINIAITDGGSDNPAGTLGTELYKSNDPGILFNPYTTLTEYAIPGPPLYKGGSSGGGGGGGNDGTPTKPAPSSPVVTPATPSQRPPPPSTTEPPESESCPGTKRKARRHARDTSHFEN